MEVLNPALNHTIMELGMEEDLIEFSRQQLLQNIAEHLRQEMQCPLVFVCTHNSRRSQLAEAWVNALNLYYDLNLSVFSAGTESTAFHQNMVNALVSNNFELKSDGKIENPRYRFLNSTMFSKTLDDPSLPKADFIAVMVCDEADMNCPVVVGAKKRFSLHYQDPKAFDGTDLEELAYLNKVREIGREICYLFRLIKTLP